MAAILVISILGYPAFDKLSRTRKNYVDAETKSRFIEHRIGSLISLSPYDTPGYTSRDALILLQYLNEERWCKVNSIDPAVQTDNVGSLAGSRGPSTTGMPYIVFGIEVDTAYMKDAIVSLERIRRTFPIVYDEYVFSEGTLKIKGRFYIL